MGNVIIHTKPYTSDHFTRKYSEAGRVFNLWYPRPKGKPLDGPEIAQRIRGLLETGYTMKEIIPWFRFSGTRANSRAASNTAKANQVWEEIKAAYDHRCAYCGKKDRNLTKDHMVPIAKGGSDRMDNVVPACFSCNRRKNAKQLLDWDKFTHLQLNFLTL